jgi:hypothetical protein
VRVKDRSTPQPLSVDEEYGRFFDGYYNLGRPGEILERSVVLSRPKGVKERALGNPRKLRRHRRSVRRLAGVE